MNISKYNYVKAWVKPPKTQPMGQVRVFPISVTPGSGPTDMYPTNVKLSDEVSSDLSPTWRSEHKVVCYKYDIGWIFSDQPRKLSKVQLSQKSHRLNRASLAHRCDIVLGTQQRATFMMDWIFHIRHPCPGFMNLEPELWHPGGLFDEIEETVMYVHSFSIATEEWETKTIWLGERALAWVDGSWASIAGIRWGRIFRIDRHHTDTP